MPTDPVAASAITPLDLEPIKAREAAATKGPWRQKLLRVLDGKDENIHKVADFASTQGKYEAEEANAVFVAHARQDIPALIAEVERQRVEHTRAILRYTLKGYQAGENTDSKHWRKRADELEATLTLLSSDRAVQPKCVIGEYCKLHGFIHGAEADELRQRFEKMAADLERDDETSVVRDIRFILDDVDARDSCEMPGLRASDRAVHPEASGKAMSNEERFRLALERIWNHDTGGCRCEHDDENCCALLADDEYCCPYCIAAMALGKHENLPLASSDRAVKEPDPPSLGKQARELFTKLGGDRHDCVDYATIERALKSAWHLGFVECAKIEVAAEGLISSPASQDASPLDPDPWVEANKGRWAEKAAAVAIIESHWNPQGPEPLIVGVHHTGSLARCQHPDCLKLKGQTDDERRDRSGERDDSRDAVDGGGRADGGSDNEDRLRGRTDRRSVRLPRPDRDRETQAQVAEVSSPARPQLEAMTTKPSYLTVDLLKRAKEQVRASVLYKRFIDGTPLENDIAVWMADFAGEVRHEHTEHVKEFLNDLYAVMVDPCAEGAITVADMKAALLAAARESREKLATSSATPAPDEWLREQIGNYVDLLSRHVGNLRTIVAIDLISILNAYDKRVSATPAQKENKI